MAPRATVRDWGSDADFRRVHGDDYMADNERPGQSVVDVGIAWTMNDTLKSLVATWPARLLGYSLLASAWHSAQPPAALSFPSGFPWHQALEL